jgi:hypothetical protein
MLMCEIGLVVELVHHVEEDDCSKLLVREGVDVKTAQTRLGHSDVRLTPAASTPRPSPRQTALPPTASASCSFGQRVECEDATRSV